MDVKTVRIGGESGRESAEFAGSHAGFDVVVGLEPAAGVVIPIAGKIAERGLAGESAGGLLRVFVFGLNFFDASGGVGGSGVFGIDLPERRMIFDGPVHQGLSDGGIVDFAVAVPAVADEVDDDVACEAGTVFKSEAADAYDGVYIFAVDV